MCLIIHKPAGISIPSDLIRTAWDDNPDGAGIMYHGDDGPKVYKVLPRDWADPAQHIEKVLAELESREAGIHFRWRTHGPVDQSNTHPVPIPGTGGYLMHNGIISGLGDHYDTVRSIMSDTAFYTLTTLQNAPGADQKDFWEIVGQDVGSYNRMLIMDAAGRFLRVNDKQWSMYKGLMLSNELSCPEYGPGLGRSWRDYYTGSATSIYDRSDVTPTGTADTRKGAAIIYIGPDSAPYKLTRRERKALNACLRSGTWGPLRRIVGK